MVNVLLLLPAALSALVLAAHFLRFGSLVLVVASLALVVLMFVRRSWAARLIQVGLVLGALEWLWTLVFLVGARRQSGQPFIRLAVILGAVTALTGASTLCFRGRALRQHFRLSLTTRDGP